MRAVVYQCSLSRRDGTAFEIAGKYHTFRLPEEEQVTDDPVSGFQTLHCHILEEHISIVIWLYMHTHNDRLQGCVKWSPITMRGRMRNAKDRKDRIC
uniref:Uncharacterized protein n=1 Tax=Steinernema glaseri TaxID=37863 RepID=A0A1I7YYQ4_9BILA